MLHQIQSGKLRVRTWLEIIPSSTAALSSPFHIFVAVDGVQALSLLDNVCCSFYLGHPRCSPPFLAFPF
jgi:hypothetical protein